MTPSMTSIQLSNWQGYMTNDEVYAMQALALEMPDKAIIAKIGAGAGTDALAMLEMREDIVIFSIDILAGESPTTTNEHLRLDEAGFANNGNLIRIWGDSKIVCKHWPLAVDWLHIDGGHLEPEIKGDLLGWLPYVKKGGYVSFHDYDSPRWPAVRMVVDMYMQKHIPQPKFSADTLMVYKKYGK